MFFCCAKKSFAKGLAVLSVGLLVSPKTKSKGLKV